VFDRGSRSPPEALQEIKRIKARCAILHDDGLFNLILLEKSGVLEYAPLREALLAESSGAADS
jgi:hypothetical protein